MNLRILILAFKIIGMEKEESIALLSTLNENQAERMTYWLDDFTVQNQRLPNPQEVISHYPIIMDT